MNKRIKSNLKCFNRKNEFVEGNINLFVAENETVEKAIENTKLWFKSEGCSNVQIVPIIE